ncbi:hypothetical protein BKA65DRAFT_37352 [Rhexocercosporidium sp. MPI-PUGE-AT-0058]|nr:hypothetical protein BKA65DRAFT_37352 [Rhexocercosporidium sp. MPI-PUGE-AT-0058]
MSSPAEGKKFNSIQVSAFASASLPARHPPNRYRYYTITLVVAAAKLYVTVYYFTIQSVLYGLVRPVQCSQSVLRLNPSTPRLATPRQTPSSSSSSSSSSSLPPPSLTNSPLHQLLHQTSSSSSSSSSSSCLLSPSHVLSQTGLPVPRLSSLPPLPYPALHYATLVLFLSLCFWLVRSLSHPSQL